MLTGIRRGLTATALVSVLSLVGCSNQQTDGDRQATNASEEDNPSRLVVALLPDESAATVIQNNQGLKEYLEATLDKDIELFVSTDYSSMIEAASNDRLDLAYFGPLSYVLARTKSNVEAFAALEKDGETTYQAVIIGNAEAGIDSLEDIAGQTMAYGDHASTSSHLIPKSMLVEQGLQAGEDYEEVFLGAHDAVAIAVQNGNAQAGGLSQPIFDSLVARGTIDPKQVVIIEESQPFPQYPWAMRSDLAPELKKQIRSAFYKLEDESVLEPFNAEGFKAMDDQDYDRVRQLGQVLDLDFEQLSQ